MEKDLFGLLYGGRMLSITGSPPQHCITQPKKTMQYSLISASTTAAACCLVRVGVYADQLAAAEV